MDVVGSIIGLCLALCAAGWTFEDARKRGMDAASAAVWALGVACLLIVFLPLYLLRRPASATPSPGALQVAQQLVQLEELKARGTLSEEAFQEAKSHLLGTEPVGELSKSYVEQSSAYINALLQQVRKVEALAAALQLQTKLTGQPEYAGELKNVQAAIGALSTTRTPKGGAQRRTGAGIRGSCRRGPADSAAYGRREHQSTHHLKCPAVFRGRPRPHDGRSLRPRSWATTPWTATTAAR